MLAGIWAAIKLLGIWKRISDALGATASWAFKHPLVAGVILLGASTWWFHREEVRAASALASRITADTAAQKVAADKLAAQIVLSNKNAQEAQAHEQTDLAAATAAGASYKSTHSVRYVFRDSAAILPATSGAGVPVGSPTSAVVLTDADFDKCGADYAYALDAYRWAQTLKR